MAKKKILPAEDPKEFKYKDIILTIRPNVLNTSDAILDLADKLGEEEWAAMLPIEMTDNYREYSEKLAELQDILADNMRTSKSLESTRDPDFQKEYKYALDQNKKRITAIEKELRSGKFDSLIALIANKRANVRLKFQNNPDNMKRLFEGLLTGDISRVVYDANDQDYLRLRRWACDYFFIIRSAIHRPIMIV